MAKRETDPEVLHRVLSTTLRSFARLSILLKPICPATVARVEAEVFQTAAWGWDDLDAPELPRLTPFAHLMTRVDRDAVDRLIDANR
jgi:methionyl-tRNA synthetase